MLGLFDGYLPSREILARLREDPVESCLSDFCDDYQIFYFDPYIFNMDELCLGFVMIKAGDGVIAIPIDSADILDGYEHFDMAYAKLISAGDLEDIVHWFKIYARAHSLFLDLDRLYDDEENGEERDISTW